MKREPVLLVMSILAGLQVFVGGVAFGELVSLKVAGLLSLTVAAIQVGLQFYVRGQVTPNVPVAAPAVAQPMAEPEAPAT